MKNYAKKVRLPLKMADDALVNTLKELKEHFDVQYILRYYKSGELQTWLNDRYYDAEIWRISMIEEESPAEFITKLAEIFSVNIEGKVGESISSEISAPVQVHQPEKSSEPIKIDNNTELHESVVHPEIQGNIDNCVGEKVCTEISAYSPEHQNIKMLLEEAMHGYQEAQDEILSLLLDDEQMQCFREVVSQEQLSETDIHLLLELTERDTTITQYPLAVYYSAIGNYQRAIELLLKCEDMGEFHTPEEIRNCFPNPQDAVMLLMRVIGQGNGNALNMLINVFLTNEDGTENQKNVGWLLAQAEHENAFAQLSLGMYYGFRENKELTLKWLHQAAKKKHPMAQYVLGTCYMEEGNETEAVNWLTQAAEQGEFKSQFILGQYYEEHGNDAESIKWYQKYVEKEKN